MPGAEGRQRRLVRIAAFVGVCLATNGLIFALGWNAPGAQATPAAIPPGPVVGAVWLVLFAAMGAAYDLAKASQRRAWVPLALAAACLAYPFYTAGLRDQSLGYCGVVATLLAALASALALRPASRRAAWLVVPVAVWTGYVAIVGAVAGAI
jgi:tryptophan-rich sensory protein